VNANHGKKEKGSRVLWIMVVLAFLLLISAWTMLILVASANQPELIEIEKP